MIQVIGRCECVQASSWDKAEIWKLYVCDFVNCQSPQILNFYCRPSFASVVGSLFLLFIIPLVLLYRRYHISHFPVFIHYFSSFDPPLFPSLCRLLHPTRAPPVRSPSCPPPSSPSTSPVPLTPHAAPIPRKPLQTASAIKDHSQSARQSARQPVRQPVS